MKGTEAQQSRDVTLEDKNRPFLSLLHDITQVMATTNNVMQSLDRALELLARRRNLLRCAITLVSPRTGEIRIVSAYGLKPSERSRGRYVLGEGIVGRVIQTGQAMYISSVSREPLFLNRTRARDLDDEDMAFICVPIRLNDQVVGALFVDRESTDKGHLEAEEQFLSIIAMLFGFAAWETQREMDASEETSSRPRGFVGSSPVMEHVYAQIRQVAPAPTTVFLQGESGTGKELAARAIHALSMRANKPFVSLNCAALPESLIESELFGHEKGSFTGATSQRKGRFEQADGGTLFLDEVGELSMVMQAKLLRVLQERAFERLGGMSTIRVDVRVITATNRDLERMVAEGTFRRDLFYRLNVFPIILPPLRQRSDDILPLANHFVARFARASGREDVRLSLAVMDMLQRYQWPGNIRELENAMERAVLLLGHQNIILPQHLPASMHGNGPGNEASSTEVGCQVTATLAQRMDELERACIVEALEASRGQIGKAAAALGLTQRVFALRLGKYGICYRDFRPKKGSQRQAAEGGD